MMKCKHQRHESNINQQKPGTLLELFIYMTSKYPCRPPRFEDAKRPTENREKTFRKTQDRFYTKSLSVKYLSHLHCATLYIFTVLCLYTLYFCQMQRDYKFKFAVCIVTKTEGLIHTLFLRDVGFILDFISKNRKRFQLYCQFIF